MHVEVKNYLPPLFVAIDGHAESLFIDSLDPRHLLYGRHYLTHDIRIFILHVHKGSYVLFRYDNHVDGGHGVDVIKGEDILSFIDLAAGYVTLYYLTKYTIFHF